MQVAHATLGAYKSAGHRQPEFVSSWEFQVQQAKLQYRSRHVNRPSHVAKRFRLSTYAVYDVGHTQAAVRSITVLAIGPWPVETKNKVAESLKLL